MSGHSAYRLSARAAADFEAILRYTGGRFGITQRKRYAELIAAAMEQLAREPERPGTRDLSALQPRLRGYHVSQASRRRSSASHLLLYRIVPDGILIVRILHEAMDFANHLGPTNDA